ncbi:DUF5018 domain-containing protein [Ichthyobacterium seriolicida]|uniref:Pkd domain containing protein n=1 Tax=Ichthyobacterium seriolicida TaxID=242600 RepID=A0A1J1E9P0_9FLAO|nr:hypothetical protein [Ichthyobacterium seriolicida]BAV94627.1 pkd domain containing protein [Ichthyobacterium seriolicida]
MFKKNYFVKSIIFSFVLLSVIIFSCDKKNIIEDDLNICIESFSLLDSENAGKKLESNIDCQINAQEHTISLTVPHTAVLDGLKFNITPCEGTTISPASGEEVNFEEVVEESIEEEATTEGADEKTTKKPSTQRYKKVFTLTKEGKSQEYTVYITKFLASDCSISSFKLEKTNNEGKIFGDRVGVISESTDTTPSTITLHVSDAATLDKALKPTIIHTGASITSGELTTDTGNNTTTINYTVTAADGKTKVYAVKYIKDLSSNNRISEFKFTKSDNDNAGLKLTRSSAGDRASDVTIDNSAGTVNVKVSTAATITALTPTITTEHTSATISPEIAAHNYADSKTYTITAEDGQTREYTVSVSKTLSNDKSMTSFKFENSVNTEKSLGQDYSAENIPAATGDADVTVNIAKIPHTVSDLTGLKPTIGLSDNATVSPGNGIAQDFTRGTPAVYTVTAQDGTTRNYNVTIPALDATAEITSFKIKQSDHSGYSNVRFPSGLTEVEGHISNTNGTHKIDISLDGEGDDSINLKPAIEFSAGATVDPASGAETTFTYGTAKTYTVTAENGAIKQYSVTVKSSNSKMKSFGFKTDAGKKIVQDIVVNSITGNTVTVKVPHDAVVTALTPEVLGNKGSKVTIKGQEKDANTEQDFSSGSATYTVTAQDGKSKTDYTVTVTRNAEPQIETFKFTTTSNNNKNLGSDDITGQINGSDIIVKVPNNADLTGLTPTVGASSTLADTNVYKGATGTTDANSTSVDFSSFHSTPVQYSAVGPAGGRKVYNVKVYKEPKIETFKFEQTENTGNTGFPTGQTYTGTIINTNLTTGTIAITVANTVNLATLKPSITVSTETGTFTSTSMDFSSGTPTVKVVNKDLTSFEKEYTVNVTKEAAPKLTSFSINANTAKGIKDNVTADLTHEEGSATGTIKLKFHKNNEHAFDLTGLSYTSSPSTGFTLTPASEISENISTGNRKITLTTTLGSTSEYTVQAVKGPYISSFKFLQSTSGNTDKNLGSDIVGTINHEDNTIKLEVLKDVTMDTGDSNKITLIPTIEVGGDSAAIEPATPTAQAFTPDGNTTVDYTVRGADNMEKGYKVSVTKKTS